MTAPSATWFLAEGATGTFFDTFILLANPNDAAADVTLSYLRDGGSPIEVRHRLEGHQRLTINVAAEDPALSNATVSTRVMSTPPIIAER